MRYRFVLLAAVLPLAACNSGPSVEATDASVGEVAGKLADAGGTDQFVNPGKWRTTVEIKDLKLGVANVPPGVAESIKQQMSATQTFEICITPEEASKPNTELFSGAESNCKYDRFNMGGGKIDAAMTCTDAGGRHSTELKGTYAPDSYEISGSSERTGQMSMSMTTHIKSERIGECDGSERG